MLCVSVEERAHVGANINAMFEDREMRIVRKLKVDTRLFNFDFRHCGFSCKI